MVWKESMTGKSTLSTENAIPLTKMENNFLSVMSVRVLFTGYQSDILMSGHETVITTSNNQTFPN